MIHHTIRLIVLFSLILVSCNKNKENTSSSDTSDAIKYSMEKSASLILEYPEIHSVSIGVYRDGEITTGYYGEVDRGKNNPATDNTLFEIASTTKSFTGLLIAQAVLDGKLTIEDDIRTYLEGSYPNLEYEGRPIKIKDLLTHTGSLRRDISPTFATMFSLDKTQKEKETLTNYTKKQLLQDLAIYKLETKPGTFYDYSPIVGPEILAFILEEVYDKSYNELLQQTILDKAGMRDTAIHLSETQLKNVVRSYTEEERLVPLSPIPIIGAAYGLKSTIPDLTKYIKYILESDDAVIKKMQEPLYHDEEEDELYGYLWIVNNGDLMHSGGTKGTTNWIVMLPEHNTGFAVAFNTNGDVSNNLINGIANYLYDDLERYPIKNAYYEVRKEILKNTDAGIVFYDTLKKDEGASFNFEDTGILNKIGYELLRKEKNADAIKVFKHQIAVFPENANAYDSLAEGYYVDEQYKLAIINYEKSVSLNPKNNNAKEMISAIKKLLSGR